MFYLLQGIATRPASLVLPREGHGIPSPLLGIVECSTYHSTVCDSQNNNSTTIAKKEERKKEEENEDMVRANKAKTHHILTDRRM